MDNAVRKGTGRIERHTRIRARLSGTAARPRLAVYKSNRYLHAQIIDDVAGHTLASGSTKEAPKGQKQSEAVVVLGTALAQKAKTLGIGQVVFDRGGFRYTGSLKALAEAARKGGLVF
jgi:large subunit ribosomal protein L18